MLLFLYLIPILLNLFIMFLNICIHSFLPILSEFVTLLSLGMHLINAFVVPIYYLIISIITASRLSPIKKVVFPFVSCVISYLCVAIQFWGWWIITSEIDSVGLLVINLMLTIMTAILFISYGVVYPISLFLQKKKSVANSDNL